MLSEELNSMIDAAIADGVITDKERQLIMKRAVREGQDPDEVEMIMEGKLNAQKEVYKPQNSKLGVIKKCPNCGATISSTSLKCPECGYVIRGVKANSTYKELYERLHSAEEDRKSCSDDEDATRENSRIMYRKMELITNCPIPNTEEDIVEFLTMASPNIKKNISFGALPGIAHILIGFLIPIITLPIIFAPMDSDGAQLGLLLGIIFGIGGGMFAARFGKNVEATNHNKLAKAWKTKCEQCMLKARAMIKDPQELARLEALISK